jgi:hypothetical protein
MKTNILSMLLLIMGLPMMVACSKAHNDDDTPIPFTEEIITGTWEITSSSASSDYFQPGCTAMFREKGICHGFHPDEDSYKISGDIIRTYIARTREPLYIYTLLSRKVNEETITLRVRVNGTLDDSSSFTIYMEKPNDEKRTPRKNN